MVFVVDTNKMKSIVKPLVPFHSQITGLGLAQKIFYPNMKF